ncbi:MAG: Phosphoglucomutase [Thermoanaerobaculia bacterium]|nr:Phosphoglucomutase [Thermoanaerobaculia bacterium]
MDAALLTAVEAWTQADPDPRTREELQTLVAEGDEAALKDRFAGRLEFGTAGLRGLIGAGPNRMNRAVVRQASAGLARYVLAKIPRARSRGIVVARDARRMSDVFALDAAGVFASYGLPVWFFPEPVPTPLGAFATRHLNAAAGVVVTASHNPPQYNGYKVYWENAAQIIPPHDSGIAAEIEAVTAAGEIAVLSEDEAMGMDLWHTLSEEVGLEYLRQIGLLPPHKAVGRDLSIVYTALHGVGSRWTGMALAESGFSKVFPVAEQDTPDGAFPTVNFPNPEEPGALDLALALAEKEGAEILIANDPDADRLAAGARGKDGSMRILTGNELGVLLGHYCLTHAEGGPEEALLLTTIVSSAQLGAICRARGAAYGETLTGFKWIMNRALELEDETGRNFVFGYEEALGYCPGRVVRDKDGISSALVFADMAAWCKSRGVTVWGYLEEIQREHGLFLSGQKNFTFTGAEGAGIIASIMEGFRTSPPAAIGNLAVVTMKDYKKRVAIEGGTTTTLSLPASNVIAFELEGGSRVTLRPSGTEPKIKYYFELKETLAATEPMSRAKERGEEHLHELMTHFVLLAKERGQP